MCAFTFKLKMASCVHRIHLANDVKQSFDACDHYIGKTIIFSFRKDCAANQKMLMLLDEI